VLIEGDPFLIQVQTVATTSRLDPLVRLPRFGCQFGPRPRRTRRTPMLALRASSTVSMACSTTSECDNAARTTSMGLVRSSARSVSMRSDGGQTECAMDVESSHSSPDAMDVEGSTPAGPHHPQPWRCSAGSRYRGRRMMSVVSPQPMQHEAVCRQSACCRRRRRIIAAFRFAPHAGGGKSTHRTQQLQRQATSVDGAIPGGGCTPSPRIAVAAAAGAGGAPDVASTASFAAAGAAVLARWRQYLSASDS
jgi:hypothetical protein